MVIRAAEHDMRDQEKAGRQNALVTVGRKAEGYFRFRDYAIDAGFAGFSDSPTYEDARRVAASVVSGFESGELDRVQLVYTRFISAGRQEVVVEPLLPLESDEVEAPEASGEPSADYEFEPNPDTILQTLLPRYTESRVYAAMLNAAASEHASRQRAMKAATDNAEELILTYRRRMNRARQDSITTEIMEIVGGAEALSQGAGAAHTDAHDAEYYDKTA
jgi:F-type H+-transporting ATPase subunit gamma